MFLCAAQFTHRMQAHAGDILRELARHLPKNAFTLGAITTCDLYPRDSWCATRPVTAPSAAAVTSAFIIFLSSALCPLRVAFLPDASPHSTNWST